MEVNERLNEILSGITKNAWELICPEEKPPDEYIVYNSELDTPEDFGDDAAQEWVNHVQVHLYTAKSYRNTKKQIKETLEKHGFTISEIARMCDRESGYFHICFSCSIQEEREE